MVPDAELEDGGAGLVPVSRGWFVMNARDGRWIDRPGRAGLPLPGCDEFEAETYFPMLGMSIQVIWPGEALLIVEGQERPLEQWDFVHCPPATQHVFVGAGDGPCVILAASSRQFQANGPWGYYTADETARRYGACSDVETQDGEVAYASFRPSRASRYREGVLPE